MPPATSATQTSSPTTVPPAVERLASLLDDRFRIPGTDVRFGLDSLIGLIPVVGDLFTAGAGALILWWAVKLQLRRRTILRMVLNLFVDWLLGSVPLIGDLFDLSFKANLRNVELMRRELARRPA
jgi:hypothetical protein